MKILHYSFGLPPYSAGGLPLFVSDIVNEQKNMGNDVFVLLPKQTLVGKSKIKKVDSTFYLYGSLPVSSIFGMTNPEDFIKKYDKSIFIKFFKNNKFDVFHVHSFMGLPIEVLEVAKDMGIRIVFTTHDYYGLCLKCNFIDYKGQVCNCSQIEKCSICNRANGLSKKKQFIIGSTFYKNIKKIYIIKKLKAIVKNKNVEKGNLSINIEVSDKDKTAYKLLLDYYKRMFALVDYFHFNSTIAKKIYTNALGDLNGDVISISLKDISNKSSQRISPKGNVITFGYIGRKEPYKGINYLMNVMKELHDNNYNFKLKLFGDDFLTFDNQFDGKVINKGTYKRNELMNTFNEINLLIVPSIWNETFGFITLEALSCGCPVIVSENVGSKDLLDSDKVFSVSDNESLKQMLIDYILKFETENEVKNVSFDLDKYNFSRCVTLLVSAYNKLVN